MYERKPNDNGTELILIFIWSLIFVTRPGVLWMVKDSLLCSKVLYVAPTMKESRQLATICYRESMSHLSKIQTKYIFHWETPDFDFKTQINIHIWDDPSLLKKELWASGWFRRREKTVKDFGHNLPNQAEQFVNLSLRRYSKNLASVRRAQQIEGSSRVRP